MIVVRAARTEDGPRLTELDRLTWSWDVAVSPLPPEGADFFRRTTPDDLLVAEDDGDVVGALKLGRATPLEANRHVLQIQGFMVDPQRQRQGIGRTLVEAAASEAAARGARRLTLRVLGSNLTAQALYRSCGFEVEGVQREEFLLDGRYVDDVLMARTL